MTMRTKKGGTICGADIQRLCFWILCDYIPVRYIVDLHLMAVSVVSPLLGIQLDERVDTHDADAGLDGTLELPDFADTGL